MRKQADVQVALTSVISLVTTTILHLTKLQLLLIEAGRGFVPETNSFA